jgi:hypothetical protein
MPVYITEKLKHYCNIVISNLEAAFQLSLFIYISKRITGTSIDVVY